MNAILAVVLFVVIAMLGRNFGSPVLGTVRPGFPAAETKITWLSGPAASASQPATQPAVTVGLKPGDRITRIEGKGVTLAIVGNEVDRFDRLALMSVMAGPDERFKVTVERQVDGKAWVGTAELGVKWGPSETGGKRLSFGIGPAAALSVDRQFKYATTKDVDPFEDGDEIVAIAGKPLAGSWQVEPMVAAQPGLTVPVKNPARGKKTDPAAPPAGAEMDLTAPRGVRFAADTVYLKDGTKLDTENCLVAKDDKEKDTVVVTSLADGSKVKHKKADLIVAPGRRDIRPAGHGAAAADHGDHPGVRGREGGPEARQRNRALR